MNGLLEGVVKNLFVGAYLIKEQQNLFLAFGSCISYVASFPSYGVDNHLLS